MRPSTFAAALLLAVLAGACCPFCGGGGDAATTTHRLDTLGLTLTLPSHFRPSGLPNEFVSADGATTVGLEPALPGPPAAQRNPLDRLPSSTVQWSRPTMIGGMSAMESRLIPSSPLPRVDWLGAIDGPTGVVWIHAYVSSAAPLGPTEFDSFWNTVKMGVQRAN